MGNPVPVQTRAVDPYSSYQSNNINKLTRIISVGEDVILNVATDDLDVSIGSTTTLIVNAGHCIKDDVYFATSALTIDAADIDFYYSDPGGVLAEEGYWYAVLYYEYAKAKPAPDAKLLLLTPTQRITIYQATPEKFLFLKSFYVSGIGEITSVQDTDPQYPTATRNLAGGSGGTVINALEDVNDVDPYSGNAGRHLAVVAGEDGTEWVDPPTANIIVNRHAEIANVANNSGGTHTIDISSSGWSYEVGSGNIVVYVNGVRQAETSYTETNPTTITLSEELTGGQQLLVTSMEDSVGANFTGIYDQYIDTSLATPIDFVEFPFSFITGHIDVYIDGVRQTPTVGFTENGLSRIDFSETLATGTELFVVALTSIASTGYGTLTVKHQTIIGNGGATYALADPIVEGQFACYIQGVRQAPSAYVLVTSTSIQFVETIPSGDSIDIFYANDSVTTNYINRLYVLAADIDGNTGDNVIIETPWTYQGGQITLYIKGVRQNPESSYSEISDHEIQITGVTISEGDEILLLSHDDVVGIQSFWELDDQNDLMPL